MDEPADRGADWLAWVMQFAVGLIVGAGITFFVTLRGTRGRALLNPGVMHHVLILTMGGGLIGAGIASWFGDELWMGSGYSGISPPQGPRRSMISGTCSILAVLAGVAVIVLVVLGVI